MDGPGLRYVVFLSGCPLRCLYCHNPDTRAPRGGRAMTPEALARDIASYKDFLKPPGGVTVSGGEPLLQQAFVTQLFALCHNMGLSTALDTSGYLGADVSDALLQATDLVLLDIKAFAPALHKKVTGIDLAPVLAFAEKCARLKIPLWIRCVVVPGLTDDLALFSRLADYLKTLETVERVEILPFHKMGEPKWKALGIPYTLGATPEPSIALIQEIKNVFSRLGYRVF